MDRNVVNCLEIKNKSDNKVLFKIDSFSEFQTLKEKIMADENIVGKEFLSKLRKTEPGLFWIENNKLNNFLATDTLVELFKKYGEVDSIIEKENCSYVQFVDIIEKQKMFTDIKCNYFKIEEFDMSCLDYIY
jgi:hypothetical protein